MMMGRRTKPSPTTTNEQAEVGRALVSGAEFALHINIVEPAAELGPDAEEGAHFGEAAFRVKPDGGGLSSADHRDDGSEAVGRRAFDQGVEQRLADPLAHSLRPNMDAVFAGERAGR